MPTAIVSGTALPQRIVFASGRTPTDEPNEKYRDAHVWYDSGKKDNFTAYKLLIADVVDDRLTAVPRGVMAAAAVMQGSRGGSISRAMTSIASRVTSRSTTPR